MSAADRVTCRHTAVDRAAVQRYSATFQLPDWRGDSLSSDDPPKTSLSQSCTAHASHIAHMHRVGRLTSSQLSSHIGWDRGSCRTMEYAEPLSYYRWLVCALKFLKKVHLKYKIN